MTLMREGDPHLREIKSYVQEHGGKFAELLQSSEWDAYDDLDKEVTCFRLKDKSSKPVRGVSISIDSDELKRMDTDTSKQLIGDTFLGFLDEGLPQKIGLKPYFTHYLRGE